MGTAKWGGKVLGGPRHGAERLLGITNIPGVGGGHLEPEESVTSGAEEVITSRSPSCLFCQNGERYLLLSLLDHYKQLYSWFKTSLKQARTQRKLRRGAVN